MSKRGPVPTPLSKLLFWEHLWYGVFLGLRGSDPSPEEALSRGSTARQLREELASLKASLGEGLSALKDWQIAQTAHQIEVELAFKHERELNEPEVWTALVQAKSADKVREACRQSKRWLNPAWRGRAFVQILAEKAQQFVRAKKDPYYPRRDSGDAKRVVFFARALAGIECGISPSTAVDRLRKMRHEPQPCVKMSDIECENCKGNGQIWAEPKDAAGSRSRQTCPRCGGRGRIQVESGIELRPCPCVHCDIERGERFYKLAYKDVVAERKRGTR
jgi:hypothetical protein